MKSKSFFENHRPVFSCVSTVIFTLVLSFVNTAGASVSWDPGWPILLIQQAQWQSQINGSVSAGLISSVDADGNGANQNYDILPSQPGGNFTLTNVNDGSDVLTINLGYDDGVGAVTPVTLSNNSVSTNFTGRNAINGGAMPNITVDFVAPGSIFGFPTGWNTWGETYTGVIDICAYAVDEYCGAGDGVNSQSDSSKLRIVYQGYNGATGLVIISGLDPLELVESGSVWEDSDDFCVGALATTNVRLKAESKWGSGEFIMQGPLFTDLLTYFVEVNSTPMTEDGWQNFSISQGLKDCATSNNFTVRAYTSKMEVESENGGDYSDELTIRVEPL